MKKNFFYLKSGLRRLRAISLCLAFFLYIAGLAFSQDAYFYDGAKKSKLYKSSDKIALFNFKNTDLKQTAKNISDIKTVSGESDTVFSNEFYSVLKIKDTSKNTGSDNAIKEISATNKFKCVSPLYFRNKSNEENYYALTGEIYVQFSEDKSEAEINDFAKTYGLIPLEKLGYLSNCYLFDTIEKTKSLDTANSIFESGKVSISSPNWLRKKSKRAVGANLTSIDEVDAAATCIDNLYSSQWHLKNTGQSGGTAGEDINVETVWDTYRGTTNEVICINDDGLEISHEDLSPNVIANMSYDYVDGDNSPMPGSGDDHGTACGGVAAARMCNSLGVRGAAGEAGLVGYRMLGADTDTNEAASLTRNNNFVKIYSNSWGPYDDGHLEGPGTLAAAALLQGVTSGRNGLGTLFTWANGNGLSEGDNSNYDGYANCRYVIPICATTNYGTQAYYSEPGANIIVNAPSSGGSLDITTVDRTGSVGYATGNYATDFGGTSSASPLAAGVVALILQANPSLTWRDVQYILIKSAERNQPSDSDWKQNGAGYYFNHKFGFGRVDALAAVNLAASWTNVGAEISATGSSSPNVTIPNNSTTGVTDTIQISDEITIESVEVILNASSHTYWGDLNVYLYSPNNTESILATKHTLPSGEEDYGFDNWKFLSRKNFGENSKGAWKLKITDTGSKGTGSFSSWQIKIYGVAPATPTPIPTPSMTPSPTPTASPTPSPTPINITVGEVVDYLEGRIDLSDKKKELADNNQDTKIDVADVVSLVNITPTPSPTPTASPTPSLTPTASPTPSPTPTATPAQTPSPWINEIHYDNESIDVDEGVEIAGPAGMDLSNYSIVAYNGSGGVKYSTLALSGTIPDQENGYGTLWFAISGLQNGAPDGIALVDSTDNVVQFLSYEGVFTATDGVAIGLDSTDIGVSETNTTDATFSLQLSGTGNKYSDFTWNAPALNTRAAKNTNQTFSAK